MATWPVGSVSRMSAHGRAGVFTLVATDVVITAAGGPVGPFRYAIIYNDTPTAPADPLVCYFDYGTSISLADTEPFTVDFGANLFTDS